MPSPLPPVSYKKSHLPLHTPEMRCLNLPVRRSADDLPMLSWAFLCLAPFFVPGSPNSRKKPQRLPGSPTAYSVPLPADPLPHGHLSARTGSSVQRILHKSVHIEPSNLSYPVPALPDNHPHHPKLPIPRFVHPAPNSRQVPSRPHCKLLFPRRIWVFCSIHPYKFRMPLSSGHAELSAFRSQLHHHTRPLRAMHFYSPKKRSSPYRYPPV